MATRNWSREELVLAFNLYWQMDFGKMHSRNPKIIDLAAIIGRTAAAVAIRLTNFANVDPYHQARGVKGMSGGRNQVKPIWDEFINNKEGLIFESEQILAEKQHLTIEQKYADILEGTENLKGETKTREVKTRVNQNFFRKIVMVNYSGKCAISGIDIPDLLYASHIIPWSKNEDERLNPENGICLSALYDKAFDKGYITINDKYEIIISLELKKRQQESYYAKYFGHLEKSKLMLPKNYLPKWEFLEFHYDTIFKK